MAKKHFQTEQIIGKLREAEVEISKNQTIGQVAKKLGITEQTVRRSRHAEDALVAASHGTKFFQQGKRPDDPNARVSPRATRSDLASAWRRGHWKTVGHGPSKQVL